jgi:hypothetical protein
MLEFTTSGYMEECLGGFSTASEGFVPERIGHNIPMSVIHSYMKTGGKKNVAESMAYNLICKSLPDVEYVIGYIRGDTETRCHEYQHAKYFFSKEYRVRVQRRWESLSERARQKYTLQLKEWGYSDEVLVDEFQAYFGGT